MRYNKYFLTLILLGSAVPQITAQNADASQRHLHLGIQYYNDYNFVGAVDQLQSFRADEPLSPEEAMQCDYYLTLATLRTGDYVSARKLAEAFLETYPYSTLRADIRMVLGDCYFLRSEYARALEEYSNVDPLGLVGGTLAQYHYRIGYSYLKLAEYDKAISEFKNISRADDEALYNAALFYRGYIAFIQGDYATAEELFAHCPRTSAPGNVADYYLSQIYYQKGDLQKAISAARAIPSDALSEDHQAQLNRIIGEALYQTGKPQEAITYLKKYASAVENPEPSALYILGLSYYSDGQYQKAIQSLQGATSGDDAMSQSAYLYIGQAQLKENNYDAAILAFNRAIQLDIEPAVTEAALYNYAVANSKGGNMPFASSVTTFEEFLTRYPHSSHAAEVQEYIVTGYLTDRNFQSALQSINRMKNPSKKVLAAKQRVLYSLGYQALANDNLNEALSYLTQASQLSSYDKEVAYETDLLLGELYYRKADYANSAAAILRYLNQSPKNTPGREMAYYMLGYTRFAQKRYKDALEDFQRAYGKSLSESVNADCLNRMGDCYYYAKQFKEASAEYAKAYKANPAAGDYALFQQAMMDGYTNNNNAKIELLDKVIADFPQSSLRPEAMLEKAQTYVVINKIQPAISAYKELISQYPSTVQGRNATLQLANTYYNDKQTDNAISTYKEVINDYPTSEEAAVAANMLKRVCTDTGRLSDYLAFIENAPTIDPEGIERAQTLRTLAFEAQRSGKETDALNYATELVEKYPDSQYAIEVLSLKAEIELNRGMGEKAIATYERLLNNASSVEQANTARLGIMRIARDLGQYDKVLEQANGLISSSTINKAIKNEAIFSRGVAYQQKGQSAEAQADWSTIASETNDISGNKAAVYLAQSLYDQGKYADAQQSITDFINASPSDQYWLARGFILLSDAYRAQGMEFEAEEYLTALKNNYPGKEKDIFRMIEERLK